MSTTGRFIDHDSINAQSTRGKILMWMVHNPASCIQTNAGKLSREMLPEGIGGFTEVRKIILDMVQKKVLLRSGTPPNSNFYINYSSDKVPEYVIQQLERR